MRCRSGCSLCSLLAGTGAWIVRYEQARKNSDIWQAVGRYHSPNPSLAASYALRVAGKVRDILDGKSSLQNILQYANGE